MSDDYLPTEKIPTTATGSVAAPPSSGPRRGALIALIVVGAVLLIALAVVITLLLTRGTGPAAGSTPQPSPSFSDPPSPSPTPSPTPTPTVDTPEEEEEDDDPPPPPPAPSGTIDSITVSVFDGDGMTPEQICDYDPWQTANSSYHDDKFNVAVNWSSNGDIDRIDVVTSDGASYPAKGSEDVIFTPFECWSGPSQARQVQITLTAFAAGTPIDTAIVIVKSNQPVQITY